MPSDPNAAWSSHTSLGRVSGIPSSKRNSGKLRDIADDGRYQTDIPGWSSRGTP